MWNNRRVNSNASPIALPLPRLSLETRIALRVVTRHLGAAGHAAVWAINYRERHAALPSITQTVSGVMRDFQVSISSRSAERALQDLRRSLDSDKPKSSHSRS